MEKLSERLLNLIESASAKVAPIKVRLKAGLSPQQLKSAVKKVESALNKPEYLSISGTVHGNISLGQLAKVSAMPEVEYIDVEKEVPINELIDPA